MALLATSLACARALAHPASSPAGISVADADAHLRAVQASADGFAIARAILGAVNEATETRVVGATMLRAKARTDGFAIAPDAAAAMTRELLDLLRGPDACTALGPHLAAPPPPSPPPAEPRPSARSWTRRSPTPPRTREADGPPPTK